jgi:hypothetical protein
MLKKGFSYIDVAVSVGIFILALSIGFVLMRPAIKQENPGPILLPLLKEGFENQTSWTIYRIPFFIKSPTPGVTSKVMVQVPFNLSLGKINLTNYDLNYKEFYYQSLLPDKGFNLTFIDVFTVEKNVYYLIYSPNFNYTLSTSDPSPSTPISSFDTAFGVREELTGISLDKFNELVNYDQLKSNFRIPKNNDFSVAIYTTNNYTKIGEYIPVEPSKEKPVYVLEYTSFILYENSTRMPVYVSLKLW